MIIFSHGNSLIPSSFGRVFMTYNKVRKPGTSMVIHATFPGMLNLLLIDVFPAGYQVLTHCMIVI